MAELHPTEILFELVLPGFLETRAAAMEGFRGTVRLSVRGTERTWTLRGGARPWLVRGADAAADLEITVEESLVLDVLAGRADDPDRWFEEDLLGLRGDRTVLDRLEFALSGGGRSLDIRASGRTRGTARTRGAGRTGRTGRTS